LRRLLKKSNRKHFIVSCFYHTLFIVICLGISFQAFAKTNEHAYRLIEYLTQEKNSLNFAVNQSKSITVPSSLKEVEEQLQQNAIKISLIDLKIDSFKEFLENQRKKQSLLNQKIKKIQHDFIDKTSFQHAQENITKLENLRDVNQKSIELIHEAIQLAVGYKNNLEEKRKQLRILEARFHVENKLEDLNDKEEKVNQTLSQLYQKNIDLQQEVKPDIDSHFNLNYEANLLINNQKISLAQQKINEFNLRKKILKADFSLLQDHSIHALKKTVATYNVTLDRLESMEQSLKKITFSYTQEQAVKDQELDQHMMQMRKMIEQREKHVQRLKKTLQTKLNQYQTELKQQVSKRQTLSEYRIENIPVIIKQIISIPSEVYQYLKILVYKSLNNYVWADPIPSALLWVCLIIIVLFSYVFSRFLKSVSYDKERYRLTGYLYDGILTIVKRNIPHLTVFAILIVALLMTGVPYSNYRLLIKLYLLWLVFRTLILIARLVLLERISDVSGKDVKLYYRIKWIILAGGWATALMILSHQLPLTLLMQDIFNRLFMLFILAVSIVSWKSREVLLHLLKPFLKGKKKYYLNAIYLLIFLLPITLFTTAIIGLLGFSNLAWAMSRYQGYVLLLLTLYILARGLLVDALELCSEWMISSLRNGWLWIEVFLKPLDKILRALLLLLSIVVLFHLFGLFSDEKLMNQLESVMRYPILNFSGVHITVLSVIEFTLLVSVFIWAAKWTREFCYRWLFRNARDPGIRNSLSVFSQYAVILVGSFITLRVLGLDFSGMSFILGGLAVGMGFGLRDFASNVIGGIMLLIERPVREGDLITLGNYEGRVAHIGIRSMRVSSWDNMEVLIPNAETFNKPFTNWTHQDNIVRTVIPIKVSRRDDPVVVQQLILDVLAIIPEVLSDPPAQVFLKQIDEALIEFEARYFINIEEHTRFEVRSKVLFAITAQFKAAGVKPPIPPLNVALTHDNHDYFEDEKSTQE